MKKMISIIITAFKEPTTVAKLIAEIENQIEQLEKKFIFELILVCPDEQTKQAAFLQDRLDLLLHLKDQAKGKPMALSAALAKASGNILILTDGDVFWGKNALSLMLDCFSNPDVGLVTGRPVPTNDKNNLFGFWAHFLTDAAHKQRLERNESSQFIDASGYLMAIRNGLVDQIPYDILADDAFISRLVFNQGKKIAYQPGSKVYVNYPDNFSDWLKQKKRSTGGYIQLDQIKKRVKTETMRSFSNEAIKVFKLVSYSENISQLYWAILLIFARLFLWLAVFWERKVINKPFYKTWVRIESTK